MAKKLLFCLFSAFLPVLSQSTSSFVGVTKNKYVTSFLNCLYFSGESMENALRACCKGIKIGKILIHRTGDNKKQVSHIFEMCISFYSSR